MTSTLSITELFQLQSCIEIIKQHSIPQRSAVLGAVGSFESRSEADTKTQELANLGALENMVSFRFGFGAAGMYTFLGSPQPDMQLLINGLIADLVQCSTLQQEASSPRAWMAASLSNAQGQLPGPRFPIFKALVNERENANIVIDDLATISYSPYGQEGKYVLRDAPSSNKVLRHFVFAPKDVSGVENVTKFPTGGRVSVYLKNLDLTDFHLTFDKPGHRIDFVVDLGIRTHLNVHYAVENIE